MEDIAQALKIIGAVLIFVLAITISFSLISKSKKTSDVVLEYIDPTRLNSEISSKRPDDAQFRIVSVDTVIATLFRYSKESFSVKIVDGNTIVGEFDLKNKNSFANQEQLENNLKDFISNTLLQNYGNKEFEERFDEATITGKYNVGENDGSSITEESGSKRMYIIYSVKY